MRYVVMGGGVAGVCCAEELCKLCHDDEVVLVSSYKTLKVNGMICALGRCSRQSFHLCTCAGRGQCGEIYRQSGELRK